MGRTPGFDGIVRALRLAKAFEELGSGATRRDILKGIGAATAIGLLGVPRTARATPRERLVGNLFFAGEHPDSFYEWQGLWRWPATRAFGPRQNSWTVSETSQSLVV